MAVQGREMKWIFSYKKLTLIVCLINLAIALYVVHFLYTSLYLYSNTTTPSQFDAKYTPDQIRKMEESVQIRKASEPIQLISVVKNLTTMLAEVKRKPKLAQHLKQMIRDEILGQLRSLDTNANATEQREAVENWRRAKLRQVHLFLHGEKNATVKMSTDEAALIFNALQEKWSMFMEEIGLWIPPEVTHKEHNDRPPGMEEFEEDPLAGRPIPQECHVELHTDYGGSAVRWGLTHHKESAADCCQACLDQAKHAKPSELKCNIWVYCPSESGCFSPDIYEHKHQECWLKYAEQPKINFKDKYSESYRSAHPTAPLIVPWVSGVVSV